MPWHLFEQLCRKGEGGGVGVVLCGVGGDTELRSFNHRVLGGQSGFGVFASDRKEYSIVSYGCDRVIQFLRLSQFSRYPITPPFVQTGAWSNEEGTLT